MSGAPRTEAVNPVLAIPEARQALEGLGVEARAALKVVLLAIAADARVRAEKSWRTRKGPMALYWKCVAVYAGHIARALGRLTQGA